LGVPSADEGLGEPPTPAKATKNPALAGFCYFGFSESVAATAFAVSLPRSLRATAGALQSQLHVAARIFKLPISVLDLGPMFSDSQIVQLDEIKLRCLEELQTLFHLAGMKVVVTQRLFGRHEDDDLRLPIALVDDETIKTAPN
jgi:hypothetical protein